MIGSKAKALCLALPALSLLAMADPAPADAGQSLSMLWEADQDLVTLQVVGKSTTRKDLRYRMIVEGASVSTTSGRVRLEPGKKVTVSTVRITAGKRWTARLEVSGDENYRSSASGGAPGPKE